MPFIDYFINCDVVFSPSNVCFICLNPSPRIIAIDQISLSRLIATDFILMVSFHLIEFAPKLAKTKDRDPKM